MASRPPVEFPDSDPVRSYSAEEFRKITGQLHAIKLAIAVGEYASRSLTADLVCRFHRAVFGGVRDHAGRHRCRGFGSARLEFLGRTSPHRDEVEALLKDVLAKARRSLLSLVDNDDHAEFTDSAFRLVAWVHVQLIGIQPFEDGNKRVAQLALDFMLIQLGFAPLTFEFCRQEYFDTLRSCLDGDDTSLFCDLVTRTYWERII